MEESVFAEWVAELRAAIKDIKGDSEMDKEPTEWTVCEQAPPPPPDLILSSPTRSVAVRNDGWVFIRSCLEYDSHDSRILNTGSLRSLIASLQSILALAEEHFGEDWGQ